MIISACLITKGDSELESLKKAVASFIDHVDHVYITTNHEHRKTKKWCSLNPKIEHSHLDWNDNFAEQRNFNFSQVSKDTEYIVWADSDDVIVGAELLKGIAEISKRNKYDVVFFDYIYGALFDGEPSAETYKETELLQHRERLIRVGSVVWKKRIHETPVPLDPENFRYTRIKYSDENPITWLHLGADRNISEEILQKRMGRNRRLLEMELEDERKEGKPDPRTLLYLMKVYAESEDVEVLRKCISMGQEYLELSGWDLERGVCYQLMSRCAGTLGEHKKAVAYLHAGIGEFPKAPIMYLYLARAYFNLGDYSAMEHWLKIGMSLEIDDNATQMNNMLEVKVLSAELLLQFYLNGKKNVRKAHDASKMLAKLNPTAENKENEEYLRSQKSLDIASEHIHMYIKYLEDTKQEGLIEPIYKGLPNEIKKLPFAIRYYNKYREPMNWGPKTICYYANFGGSHFEKWDGNSLAKGIGGSETAVIRLSEEWVKKGYRVVVYGDPKEETVVNGVLYAPWYKFNHKDRFNIFIQWRRSNLVDRINAKKVYIDLHDVFHESSHLPRIDQVDKFMVKSTFHREYGENMPDEKMKVISNGI